MQIKNTQFVQNGNQGNPSLASKIPTEITQIEYARELGIY